MIDLHCHILPEVDDGSQSLQQSLKMADIAADSGVRTILATPHCTGDRLTEFGKAFSLLEEALDVVHIPIRLLPGAEIFGTDETARLLEQGKLLTLNGSRYPLIEFDFYSDGLAETRILSSVLERGFRPVVAHPERYAYLQEEPSLVDLWVRMGCLLQINRGSLLGRFGTRAQKMAYSLVSRGFVTAVASDAHSHAHRTPWLEDVYSLLCEEFSPETADTLLHDNPLKIISDEDLPPVQPEWFE